MPDIFISYSYRDREYAQSIVAHLRGLGYITWADFDLLPGESFERVILDKLADAKVVIVLWSRSSFHSPYFLKEAEWALRNGVYFPIIIDDSITIDDLPLVFKQFNTPRLKYAQLGQNLSTFLQSRKTTISALVVGMGAIPTASALPLPFVLAPIIGVGAYIGSIFKRKSDQKQIRISSKSNLPDNRNALRKKAFVSYSSLDEKMAISCVGYLESKGCPCWIACRDVEPGEDHRQQIVLAISNTDCLVCLFSKNANGSIDIGIELLLARRRKKKRFVLKVDDCEPAPIFEYELITVQWIEFSASDPENSYSKIAEKALFL